MREPISKKLRFEVFKRDSFACQYCGKTPPVVTLEIDHIIPVSKNGKTEIDNLITSCFDCNRGKGSVELTSLPETTQSKMEIMAEREEQYKSLKKLQLRIHKRINKEINQIEEVYTREFEDWVFSDGFKNNSVKRFIDNLGFIEVLSAMEAACARVRHKDRVLKYFCAICWNKMRDKYE